MEEQPAPARTGVPPTPVAERTQRLHRFSGAVHELIDELGATAVNPVGLTVREVEETVRELVPLPTACSAWPRSSPTTRTPPMSPPTRRPRRRRRPGHG